MKKFTPRMTQILHQSVLAGAVLVVIASCSARVSRPSFGSKVSGDSNACIDVNTIRCGKTPESDKPIDDITKESEKFFPVVKKGDEIGDARLWRLSTLQLNHTLTALLGVKKDYTKSFDAEVRASSGFGTDSEVLKLDSSFASNLETVIGEAVKDGAAGLLTYLPCKTLAALDAKCVSGFIDEFGKRAFRRAVTANENTRYSAVYKAVSVASEKQDALAAVAEAILRSPNTMYRFEIGAVSDSDTGGQRPLTGPELATALAFSTTNMPPDAELTELGASGELLKKAVYLAQVNRMIESDAFSENFSEFIFRLSGITWMGSVKKDATFPEYKDDVQAAMKEEAKAFIKKALASKKGSFKELMTQKSSTITPPLAPIYSLPAFTEKKTIDWPATRAGFINLPAVITANSPSNHSGPVQRGLFVLSKLTCFETPAPPPEAAVTLPEVDASKSLKERFAIHESNKTCAACHSFIDPAGFAFEGFDAIGRTRVKDDYGAAISTSGTLPIGSAEVNFNDSAELAEQLTNQPNVHACFVRQAFHYTMGRSKQDFDNDTLRDAYIEFVGSNLNIKSLFLSYYLSDTFRYRQ